MTDGKWCKQKRTIQQLYWPCAAGPVWLRTYVNLVSVRSGRFEDGKNAFDREEPGKGIAFLYALTREAQAQWINQFTTLDTPLLVIGWKEA
jgi:hypothetical protein